MDAVAHSPLAVPPAGPRGVGAAPGRRRHDRPNPLGFLDKIPRAQVRVGDRAVSTWRALAVTGIVAALGTALSIAALLGEPALPVLASGVLAMAGYFAVVVLKWKLSGTTPHVLFEGLAASLLAAAFVHALHTGTATLRGLDIQAAGMAALFTFGRVGCFVGGCCWGSRSELGVAYPHECPAGRTPGRKLPVQLVEAATWAALGAVATLLALFARPGAAAGVLLVVYSIVRVGLERLRADPRPAWLGLSFSTWASAAALLAGACLLDASAPFPGRWLVGLVAIGAGATLALSVWRLVGHHELPLEEFRAIGESIGSTTEAARGGTWLVAGVRVSVHASDRAVHVVVRGEHRPLSRAAAGILLEQFLRGLGVQLGDTEPGSLGPRGHFIELEPPSRAATTAAAAAEVLNHA